PRVRGEHDRVVRAPTRADQEALDPSDRDGWAARHRHFLQFASASRQPDETDGAAVGRDEWPRRARQTAQRRGVELVDRADQQLRVTWVSTRRVHDVAAVWRDGHVTRSNARYP